MWCVCGIFCHLYFSKHVNIKSHLDSFRAVDLDRIEDDLQRQATLTQIRSYGQTPRRLFTKAHPPRNTQLTAVESPVFCIPVKLNPPPITLATPETGNFYQMTVFALERVRMRVREKRDWSYLTYMYITYVLDGLRALYVTHLTSLLTYVSSIAIGASGVWSVEERPDALYFVDENTVIALPPSCTLVWPVCTVSSAMFAKIKHMF